MDSQQQEQLSNAGAKEVQQLSPNVPDQRYLYADRTANPIFRAIAEDKGEGWNPIKLVYLNIIPMTYYKNMYKMVY